MKDSTLYTLLILVQLFSGDLIMPVSAQTESKEQVKITPDFVLEDQFKNKQDINFPADKDRILIFFKMQMSDESYNKVIDWKSHFESHFNDSVDLFLIGVHPDIIGFLKPTVRGFMDDKDRTLIDWGGDVGEKYGCQDGIKVMYITAKGLIRRSAQGEFGEEKIKNFTKRINAGVIEK